jgi:peptidoglycan/xylan/chitin deacetylase (PgdA/CDA1 family)
MIFIAYENQEFRPQIEYTFKVIFYIYGIEAQLICYPEIPSLPNKPLELLISYGKEKPPSLSLRHIHIYESDLFGQNYLKPNSMPKLHLKKYNELPVIYSSYNEGNCVSKSENLTETNIDIVASCFFMLSRYEEVIVDRKDQHNRFPANASLAATERFLDRPIVNEYAELLWGWIHELVPSLERKSTWPENKDFAVCLTHDVDSIRKYSLIPPITKIGSAIILKKNPQLAFNLVSDYLGCLFHLRRDPFDTFDYILDLEQRNGFKSSFYFISGKGAKFEYTRSLTDPKIMKLIRMIEDRGCEVGLHGSHRSYHNSEQLILEKAKIDRVVRDANFGCRQHYLRFKTPETWRNQEEAKLLYDSTLAFADRAGFRCGICLPFKPLDVLENRPLNLWELPLTVMEGSLKEPEYENLSPGEAYNEIIRLMEVVNKYHGVFVLLWHNSSFDPLNGWSGWKEVYESTMKYIREQNAWVTSGKEVIDWWTKRF